jgi:hypothetical protein
MYADLVKESEKQEIFFEKVYTITDLSNKIIENFRGHSDSSKNRKQDNKEIEQRFEKMIEDLTK